MVGEEVEPCTVGEYAVKPFQSWATAFTGPSVEAAVQVHIGKQKVVDNPAETSHPGAVEIPLVFILIAAYQVEIPTEYNDGPGQESWMLRSSSRNAALSATLVGPYTAVSRQPTELPLSGVTNTDTEK